MKFISAVKIEGEMAICDDQYHFDTNDTITLKNHTLYMEIENRLQETVSIKRVLSFFKTWQKET